MNTKPLFILLFAGLTSLCTPALYAQDTDPDVDVNLWASHPVVIDGNSADWHEPLNNYNTGTKLAFALANDQNNLYMIIESEDQGTTSRMINGGLTLNINTSGKKRDGIKLNFLGMHQPPLPHGDQRDSMLNNQSGTDGSHDEHGLKVIQVSGFKHIPDGALAIPNQNGVEIAAAFDKQGDYICELSIPLSALELKGDGLAALAYNIKLNSSIKGPEHHGERPAGTGGGGGGRGMGGHGGGGMSGGMGGGGMGGGRSGGGGGRHGGGMGGRGSEGSGESGGQTRASDFWIKYVMARPTDSFKLN